MAPGESLEHEHSIYLFEGEEAYLDSLSTQLLGRITSYNVCYTKLLRTRVPFIVYWKGKVQPLVSDAVISQVDILSSLAAMVGSDEIGPDSQIV